MERMSKSRSVAQRRFTSKSREQEAASQVERSPRMAAQRTKLQGLFGNSAQLEAKEEEPLQKKHDAGEEEFLPGKFGAAQRVKEEEPLQAKFGAAQRVEEEEPVQKKPNETGLPDNLKSGIESLSGMSMDSVKVHYNSSRPAQLNALAYAQGTDIHVAPGQEQHLPHEAWHVVQQAQGRVQPTMQMKEGVPVNDDKSLEHEADVMGAKALSENVMRKTGDASPVQRKEASVAQFALGTLGGYRVNEAKYVNGNWGTIETHMKGEWGGGDNGAVTGGHVLNGMTGEWGASHFSVARAKPNVNASGVYFEGANNLPKNIDGTQHDFYLATVGNQKKLSNIKSSSFWPKGWSLDNLKATLDDSHTTNQANIYASKANTSYWYTWQTLGANTVFPVARYSELK